MVKSLNAKKKSQALSIVQKFCNDLPQYHTAKCMLTASAIAHWYAVLHQVLKIHNIQVQVPVQCPE